MSTKEYLGDSVYAEIEHGMIKLTTENGYGPSNEIFLEPEVFDALGKYVERIKQQVLHEAQSEPEEEPEEEYREEGCYSPNGDPINMMPHDWTDAGEGFRRCRICGKVVE